MAAGRNTRGAAENDDPIKTGLQAIEEANEVFTSFWDAKTGKTVYLADPLVTDMTEEDKALAAAIEDTPERFLRFPTKYEIHQYRIMEDFVDQLSLGKVQKELAYAIRGKARSADSNSLCAITGWNSVGMTIWRRRTGTLRSAGVQRKAWSTWNEREREKDIAAEQ